MMPDTLRRVAEIQARLDSGYAEFKHPLMVAVADVSELVAHIDALTAAVEALPFLDDEDEDNMQWVLRAAVLAILKVEPHDA